MAVDTPRVNTLAGTDVGMDIAQMFEEIARMAEMGEAHVRVGKAEGRTDVSGVGALQRIRNKALDDARFLRGDGVDG